MKPITLDQVSKWSEGTLSRSEQASAKVGHVFTDSRDVRANGLFVALKGERFDGHEFVQDVLARGAGAAMVRKGTTISGDCQAPMIVVGDTLTGLQKLAAKYRSSLKVQTVAVAGSNGKTGTKEMTAAVLGTRFSVLKTQGNLNNHIGVPLSLLQLEEGHQMGVFEVGTNHPGELVPLLEMVQPLAGIITTIGEEHLEFFGDLDGVAREEGSVAEALPTDGLLVLSADDERCKAIASRTHARVVFFGLSAPAEYRAEKINLTSQGTVFELITPRGRTKVNLGVLGRHQVANALAAAAVGEFFGLGLEEIQKGLESVKPYKMRMENFITSQGAWVINDAYNANPSSMQAALEVVRELAVDGRKVAVLGEMRELGAAAVDSHERMGKVAAGCGLDLLVVVGDCGKDYERGVARAGGKLRVEKFSDVQAVAGFLRNEVRSGDLVLLKASRGVALEHALEGWN